MLYACLLLIFILEYVRPGYWLPLVMVLKLYSVVPLSTFLGSLFHQGRATVGEVFGSRNGRYLGTLVCLVLFGVVHADVTLFVTTSFETALGYYLLFFMIGKLVDTRAKFRGVITALMLAHIALIVLNPGLVLNPGVRSYVQGGTFLGDGNDFALSVVLLVPLSLMTFLEARGKLRKLVYLAFMLAMMAAVIGTQSRGASLACAGMLLMMWWYSQRKWIGAIMIGLVVVGVFSFAPDVYFERMGSIAEYQTEGSAQGRITAWKAAWQMALDNPLWGVGAGHFPVAYGVSYSSGGPWLTAHSMYFLAMGELGFPGVLLVIFFLWGNFRLLLKRIKQERHKRDGGSEDSQRMLLALLASLIGFSIAAAFLSVLYYPHLFVLGGLIFAGLRIIDYEQKAVDASAGPSAEQSSVRNRGAVAGP